MPWQDNSGKNGSGRGPTRGPWGQSPRPPGGGNGGGNGDGRGPGGKPPEPPDFEELLQASRQRFKRAFTPRAGSGGGMRTPQFNRQTIGLAALAIGGLWLFSGFYQVGAKSLGVVTTFGKYTQITGPGLHWHAPFPFQGANVVVVTEVQSTLVPANRAERGERSEGLMLTGDKNIVDVGLTVQWRIKSGRVAEAKGALPPVAQYLYRIENPKNLVLTVAEAAIREVVGRNELDFIQTDGRSVVQEDTRTLMQETLDAQLAGIEIIEVNLEKTDPPTTEVNDAFLDVIAAGQDREQFVNRAREYANRVVPEARGQAQRALEEARAYQARVTAEARGQAERFSSILGEYQKAPEVTRERMYLETVERVLAPMNKVIVDEDASGGVVPYLPLSEIKRPAAAQGNPQ